MGIRPEVIPSVVAALAVGALVFGVGRLGRLTTRKAGVLGIMVAAILTGYLLYFFRDPDRTPPSDAQAAVAGADGTIAGIVRLDEAQFRRAAAFAGLGEDKLKRFLGQDVVRISIFLSLFDVHVNRASIGGESEFLGYFPGKHIFTFKEKSSDYNQHNSILIQNPQTVSLINQIVGPVARRVVYWPDHNRSVPLKIGDRIGMMKFGSRLDMYFPGADVDVKVKAGDVVRAGETIVARIREKAP